MTDFKNWKTGISTSATDYETLKHYADNGITAIEFGTRWNLIHEIDWQALKRNADKAGVELWSYHLPFCNVLNIGALQWDVKYITQFTHKTLIEQASKVGIKNFVVHSSSEPIADEDREKIIDLTKYSVKFLCDVAESVDGTMCFENVPRTCITHNAEEMKELMDYDSRARICFDVNHLNYEYGSDHKRFMELCADRIQTLHVSDYYLGDEMHLFPGEGKINWNELITMLEEHDYSGPFLYEGGFSPSANFPDIPHGSIETARARHMEIKNFYGSK